MSALAGIAADLTATQRQAIAARIPTAQQQVTTARVAAVEAAIGSEFIAWANAGGSANTWATAYVAVVLEQAAALYAATASLTQDYTAMWTLDDIPPPVWTAQHAAPIAGSNWKWTPVTYLNELQAGGLERTAAIDRATRKAMQLASLDVNTTPRTAVADYEARSGGRITGQRKQPFGGACGWCRNVAGKPYRARTRVPSHANDRCGVAPIVRGDNSAQTLSTYRVPADVEDELLATPAVPTAAIRDELGLDAGPNPLP